MPNLSYRLRSRRLILEASSESEGWELVFDAVNTPTDDLSSFKVLSRGQEYDAYDCKVMVTISPKISNTEQLSNEQNDYIGTVKCIQEDGNNLPPQFEVELYLNKDLFYQLVAINNHSLTTELWMTTESNETGLRYGADPDGNELEWYCNESIVSNVEEVRFSFIEKES